MPIDDLRTRAPAARPVADAADNHLADLDHDDEPGLTLERLAEIEAAWIAEALRRAKDLDEGRVVGIPWEEARVHLFDAPTAEEFATLPARRARR